MVLNSPEPAMNKMLRQHAVRSFIYLGRFHFCTVVGIMGYKNNHSYRFYSPGFIVQDHVAMLLCLLWGIAAL